MRATTTSLLLVQLAAPVLLLALASSVQAGPLFGPSTEYSIGGSSVSVAIADLNADGRPDLVTANYISNTISVLLGNGDGTFAASADFGTGSTPFSVAIADLNADERLDLAVANYGSNTVSVLLGNGDGTFGLKSDIVTGSSPTSVAIADLNADGRPDLAVANSQSNTVSVLLGNGDGTFGPKTDSVAGADPNSVATADLNADGRPDLVVGNFAHAQTVTVLLGNGDGSFGPKRAFATGSSAFSVAIADLNADGRPDVTVTHPGEFTVSVLLGNGNGSFGARTDYGTQRSPVSVAIADLNVDGSLDLAVACASSDEVSVLLGNGDGTFAAQTGFGTGTYPRSVAIADLNADGRLDLVTANLFSRDVSVLLNLSGPIAVEFDLRPNTLNPASRGRWVTGTIALVPPLSAREIDVASIRLNGSVPVDRAAPAVPGGPNVNGVHELRVSFDRAAVEATLSPGTRVPVSITGTVNDREFVGTDTIRVRSGTGPIAVDITHESSAGENPPALSVRAWSVGSAAGGQLRVECVLPGRSAARLDLLDVAGRVMTSRQVDQFGPGRHTLELASERALPQGIYFVRLRQGADEARSRAAVSR